MNLDDLHQMHSDLLQEIWMLTLENDMYERYLSRQDPHSLKSKEYHQEHPGQSKNHKKSYSTLIAKIIAITIAHRMFMARKEVEEMKRKLEQMQVFVQKKKATMRAKIEEIEIRISEAHESTAEFESEVVVEGVDSITGKIPAERVIRFIEEWLRSANTILERLRLKSATLRMQIRKARQQLAQRKELGELLHAVDFEKLSIENQDYAKMLEEKNLYVIDMKRIAGGYYHLKLTQHKQKLEDLLRKLNEVKSEIITKQDQIKELKIEQRVVEVKVKRLNKKLQNLLSFMDNHIAPDILEFVHIQVECEELDKTYKLLQRRRNIEKIIFEEYKKQSQIRKESHMDEEARWGQ
ncbi:cilia- and flagella-associated protein 263-like [Bombus fervidus]|uniref:cilia- and flagella-associated protein 263-like n=1 Tax=Bombus fervidus TaxID=203811 RepID=UPI003AB27CE7